MGPSDCLKAIHNFTGKYEMTKRFCYSEKNLTLFYTQFMKQIFQLRLRLKDKRGRKASKIFLNYNGRTSTRKLSHFCASAQKFAS